MYHLILTQVPNYTILTNEREEYNMYLKTNANYVLRKQLPYMSIAELRKYEGKQFIMIYETITPKIKKQIQKKLPTIIIIDGIKMVLRDLEEKEINSIDYIFDKFLPQHGIQLDNEDRDNIGKWLLERFTKDKDNERFIAVMSNNKQTQAQTAEQKNQNSSDYRHAQHWNSSMVNPSPTPPTQVPSSFSGTVSNGLRYNNGLYDPYYTDDYNDPFSMFTPIIPAPNAAYPNLSSYGNPYISQCQQVNAAQSHLNTAPRYSSNNIQPVEQKQPEPKDYSGSINNLTNSVNAILKLLENWKTPTQPSQEDIDSYSFLHDAPIIPIIHMENTDIQNARSSYDPLTQYQQKICWYVDEPFYRLLISNAIEKDLFHFPERVGCNIEDILSDIIKIELMDNDQHPSKRTVLWAFTYLFGIIDELRRELIKYSSSKETKDNTIQYAAIAEYMPGCDINNVPAYSFNIYEKKEDDSYVYFDACSGPYSNTVNDLKEVYGDNIIIIKNKESETK